MIFSSIKRFGNVDALPIVLLKHMGYKGQHFNIATKVTI